MRRKRLIYEGLAHGIKLGYVLDESGTDGPKCHKRAVSRRKVLGATRCLVNASSLKFQ